MRKKIVHVFKGKHLFLLLLFLTISSPFSFITNYSVRASTSNPVLSEDEILENMYTSLNSIYEIYNQKEGIFVWNIQDLDNLSRYGDLTDSSNGQQLIENDEYENWVTGLSQDLAVQYDLLKNNLYLVSEHFATKEEKFMFNREWVFTTESIIRWLYQNIATNNELMSILSEYSATGDGFGEYWNIFIREKYHEYVDATFSLLPDTFVLGTKILHKIEQMSYLSNFEKDRIRFLIEMINNWWDTINAYAVFDPGFAIAAQDNSLLSSQHNEWIGWKTFLKMGKNDTFKLADIRKTKNSFVDSIYTSPQIANFYLTYLEKNEVQYIYQWQKTSPPSFKKDSLAYDIFHEIITNYASHIEFVNDRLVYLFTPGEDAGWISLNSRFSGHAYVWDNYLIDQQDTLYDYYEYQKDVSPLKIAEVRTYQGAGDIRGLMDIVKVLQHSFTDDFTIQLSEKSAAALINTILQFQRDDGSFILSPYYGTAIPETILSEELINDALIINDINLPKGLRTFTGTMTIADFLIESRKAFQSIGTNYFSFLINDIDEVLMSIGDLYLSKRNDFTLGITKQALVANNSELVSRSEFYDVSTITIKINLENQQYSLSEVPNWFTSMDSTSSIAYTKEYQWDFLHHLQEFYQFYQEDKFITPLYETLELFYSDYLEDQQYQLISICEVEDAIARVFFDRAYDNHKITLTDKTNIYGNSIPYYYRENIKPVTHAFTTKTIQKISHLLLGISLDVLPTPINQVDFLNQIVIAGFVFGLFITIGVIYVKRPKNI